MRQHLLQVHDLRLVPDEGEHDDAERVLQLRVLVEVVQDHARVDVMPQLDDDAHAFAVGFVAQVCDAVDLLVADKFRDLRDQVRLVDEVGEFRDDDPALAVRHRLDVRHRAGDDLAPAGAVRLARARRSHDNAAGREVRRLHDRKKLLDVRVAVFLDLVLDHLVAGLDHLAQIVRRNVRRHADRDTGRAIH